MKSALSGFIPKKNCDVKTEIKGEITTLCLGGRVHSLNASSLYIWDLIDGHRSVTQVYEALLEAFPEIDNNALKEIDRLILDLSGRNLLSLKEASNNGHSESAIKKSNLFPVKYFTIPPDLIWNLEQVRQVVAGILDIYPQSSNSQKIDLSETALKEAIYEDIDTAGSNRTSQTIPYANLTLSRAFKQKSNEIRSEILSLIEQPEAPLVLRGHAYYKASTSMGWHSNHSAPGRRIYCSWASEEKKNFFRYLHPESGEIITDWEPAGWTVKTFVIPNGDQRLWHCIHSESTRFTLGFGIMAAYAN